MIAIENFRASTSIETSTNVMTQTNCRVVGITKNEDGNFEFVVMIEEDGDRWLAQRDYVSALDGKTYWPE